MNGRLVFALAAALLLLGGAVAWRSLDRGGHTAAAQPLAPESTPRTSGASDTDPLVDVTRTATRTASRADREGAAVLRVVDEDGAPIFGAEAYVSGRDGPVVSDPAGVLDLHRAGTSGFLVADGFRPLEFEVTGEAQELRLLRDRGVELTLYWENGQPLVGAIATAVFEVDSIDPERVRRLAPEPRPSDEAGRTVLGPYRIGIHTAHLRLDLPGGWHTTVRLPDDLDEDGVTSSFTAWVPSVDTGHTVRVVDAEGRPLVGRTLTMEWFLPDEGVTDSDGSVHFAAQVNANGTLLPWGPKYTLDLGPGRGGWFERLEKAPREEARVELRVAPVRVFGRVDTPAPASYRVATAAVANPGLVPAAFDDLVWHELELDGSFEFSEGWQGPESAALLRHHGFGQELDVEAVPPGGGPVLFQAPDVCRVAVTDGERRTFEGELAFHRVEPRRPRPEGESRGGFLALGSSVTTLRTTLSDLPGTLEVPRGRYQVTGRSSGIQWSGRELDATGPTAELDLASPQVVRVRGRVLGSLRGPIRGLELRFDSASQASLVQSRTDRDGRFEVDVLADGEIAVTPRWGDEHASLGLLAGQVFERRLDAEHPEAEFVIEEAVLEIVERPPSPLLAYRALWLDAVKSGGDTARGPNALRLDEEGRTRLYVAPGTYRVRRRFDATWKQEVSVTVEPGETTELVLDSSKLAVLAIDVVLGDHAQRGLRIRALDRQGRMAAYDARRRLRSETYEFRDVVEPGTYAVEVEAYARGAMSSDEPLDVWRGDVAALPGARAPLRVFLR